MPFKSEKQRRYLWATQPELAKLWANKYPESNKGLPMYADEKKEKKTAQYLHNPVYVNKCAVVNLRGYSHKGSLNNKAAADATYRVKLPNSDKPTYAGQKNEESGKPKIQDENAQVEQRDPENAINSLLQKIAIVLSRPMAQRLENRKARREQRKPAYKPKNHGIHQYAAPTPYTPLPMGAQPQPTPQPQQTAANTQVSQPANTPSAHPIQSFGPLAADGNINGNAAFGQKNSPDSSKTANFYNNLSNFITDPVTLAALAGTGTVAGGLGLAYMFGNGPNSRKGRLQQRQTPADRKHFATLENGTKIYRQNWRPQASKDGLTEHDVADFVDEKGNRADPFQLGSTLHSSKTAGGNNDGLAEMQSIDADLFFINDPEYLDYEDAEMFDKTAALQDIYSKWAGSARTFK